MLIPLIMNGTQWSGWLIILIVSAVNIGECPAGLLWFTAGVQALNGYDLWQHLLAGRRSAVWPWVLQNGARMLFTGLLLYAAKAGIHFDPGGVADMASLLLVVWSLAELSRFSFYLFPGRLSRWMRYNVFLVAYPTGVAIELGWLYRIFTGTSFILGKFLLVLLVFAYLFGFPYLFLYLYRKRKKMINS